MACDGINSEDQDVEMSSVTSEQNEDFFSKGNNSTSWYEHPRYSTYWAHHRKVCGWFKKHRKVKQELQYQQYVQRWQQWYQQQSMTMNPYYYNSADQSYYMQCINWYNQMYQWCIQQNYPQQQNEENTNDFKVPSSPAPKSRWAQTSETDRRRKRTESNGSRMSGSRPGSRGSNSSGGHRGARRKRTRKDKNRRKTEQIIVQMDDEEFIFESQEAGSDDGETEEFEMEITEDMLQFFAASAKHRHLRDTMKEKDEITGEEKRVPREENYVELGEVEAGKNKASILPPSERPGVKRTSEMKLLYGAGAAMIHGMETAMQLTFDRNCDIYQPKLWPHLPLSIKFD